MLRVKSMKDWVAQGTSLDLAIKVLSLLKQGKSFKEAMSEASGGNQSSKQTDWNNVTPEQVSNYDALERVIEGLTSKKPIEIYQHFGASSRTELSITAWEAFLYLKEAWV